MVTIEFSTLETFMKDDDERDYNSCKITRFSVSIDQSFKFELF